MQRFFGSPRVSFSQRQLFLLAWLSLLRSFLSTWFWSPYYLCSFELYIILPLIIENFQVFDKSIPSLKFELYIILRLVFPAFPPSKYGQCYLARHPKRFERSYRGWQLLNPASASLLIPCR